MNQLNEDLLNAWLKLSKAVINNRLVSDMPYNEALICNILYRNQTYNSEKKLTATDLCNETKMLKSQMNRTLNQMEQKNLIVRERSDKDRRNIFITINCSQVKVYVEQHSKILKLVDTVIEKLGEKKAMEAIELLSMISSIANNTFE